MKLDIASNKICKVFANYKPVGIFNLAAETHVDRSIDNPYAFIHSNLYGTFSLLEVLKLLKMAVK